MSRPAPPLSTLGGPGWRGRAGTLRDDIGVTWASCGLRREWDRLRSVLLVAPPASLGRVRDAGAWLMHRVPDRARMLAQLDGVVAAYRAHGVEVHVHVPPDDAPPNVIFARDLFAMTPEGALVARMAAAQRAGEERVVAAALAGLGVPIRATVHVGTFEGADALRLGDRVLVGVGRRTDRVPEALAGAVAVPVPAAVQHLLGAVNVIDHDLAAVHPAAAPELRSAFPGFTLLEIDDEREREDGRAMNFVTLGPREVLMPAGCPRTRARYEAHGVVCHEVEVGEYVAAAGALGCVTGVLLRA